VRSIRRSEERSSGSRWRRFAFSGAAACTAAVATLSFVVSASAAPSGPIKIGVIFPLSGPVGEGGIVNLHGVTIAVNQLNAAGGIAGRKVVLIPKDSPSPATAASNATKLINATHVQEIIGSVISTLALAAAPVANRYKDIYWEVEAVANTLTKKGYKYLFRIPCDSNTLGSTAAQYAVQVIAKKLGIPPSKLRVGVISVTGAYGSDTTHGVLMELKKLGIKPVATVSFSVTTTSLQPQILKLKQARPDIVITTSYTTDASLFINESKQLGFHFKALVGTGAGQTPEGFEKALGSKADGILSSSFAYNVANSSLDAAAKVQNQKFIHAFKAAYHVSPTIGAYLAYVGTEDLFTVMKKADGPTPNAVRTAAFKVNLPLGSSVNGWGLKFASTGQNILSPATVVQWQSKVLKVISPSRFATGSLQTSSMAH
jgi:branched-chain amino acid transport system substrate-binding protein